VVAVERVTQQELVVDVVLVTSPDAGLGEVPGSDEVVDNRCRRALGDADGHGDVAKPHGRFAGDALQDVCVVGEESLPGRPELLRQPPSR
jgi:hypothetical protein